MDRACGCDRNKREMHCEYPTERLGWSDVDQPKYKMVLLPLVPAKFVSLVFDRLYDEASAFLREQCDGASGDEIPRLVGVEEALRSKVEQLGSSPSAQRQALAGIYMAAHQLRRQKYWHEAEAVYLEVVERSLATNEAFFLNDARLSRAVCLKNLGRMSEYERAKAEVPAGTTTLIDGVNWRVEDL